MVMILRYFFSLYFDLKHFILFFYEVKHLFNRFNFFDFLKGLFILINNINIYQKILKHKQMKGNDNMKKSVDLEKVVKIKRIVDDMVKGKYKVSYRHASTTNSFYIILSDEYDLKYQIRFSDHLPKDNHRTFRTFFFERNYTKKDLEKFIKDAINRLEIKRVNFLLKNIA